MISTGHRSPEKPIKARLNVRIDKDLLSAVKIYARKQNTTVTAIIVERFEEIRNGDTRTTTG
jgi:predicted HicB family RNase H-like nuclease